MITIHKFTLDFATTGDMLLPRDARIIRIGEQDRELFLWAIVDTDEPMESRRIRIYGTGHPIHIEQGLTYLGTAQVGALVWHVFEIVGKIIPIKEDPES